MHSIAGMLATHVKPGSTGLEIGVGEGDSTVTIIRTVRPARLDLVDCYKEQPRSVYPDDFNVAQELQNHRMAKAIHRVTLEAHEMQVEVAFHREMAQDYLARVIPASLDFVYLDANHSYDSVSADLLALWPALKRPGVVFCHDYCREVGYFGVIEAVSDFIARREDASMLGVSAERFPVAVVKKAAQ